MHAIITKKDFKRSALILALLSFLCIFIYTHGGVQFGGADAGFMSNAAWQYYNGFKPYVDFITATPPAFLIGARLAFTIFGIHYLSFVYIAICFCVVAFLLHWAILNNLVIPFHHKVLFVFLTQVVTILEPCWWWYNPISTSAATIFLTAVYVLLTGRPNASLWIFFTISTILLSLMKVNVAGITLAIGLIILFTRPGIRKEILISLLISLVVSVTILFLCNIDIIAMLKSYLGARNRALNSGNILEFLYFGHPDLSERALYVWLPFGAILISILIFIYNSCEWTYANWRIVVLAIASILISALCMITNNDDPADCIPIALLGVIVIWFYYLRDHPRTKNRRLAETLFLIFYGIIISHGISVGVDRSFPRYSGLFTFYDAQPQVRLTEIKDPRFLGGVKSGIYLEKTLQEINATLNIYNLLGQKNAPVFFGPRIDFCFPTFGILNRKGLPLWWNAYGEIPKNVEDSCIENFINNEYKVCIFMKNDFPYIPQKILQYLNENYIVSSKDYITVFTAKNFFFPLNKSNYINGVNFN